MGCDAGGELMAADFPKVLYTRGVSTLYDRAKKLTSCSQKHNVEADNTCFDPSWVLYIIPLTTSGFLITAL